MLSKDVSSTTLWVFVMTQPSIELQSHGPFTNTQPTRPMGLYIYIYIHHQQISLTKRSSLTLWHNRFQLTIAPGRSSVSALRCTRFIKCFQIFFIWALLLIVHTWNSSPLQSNLLQLQCTCTVPTTSGRPHRSPLVWACQ